MSIDPNRTMPASEEAEKGVLCSFLLDPDNVGPFCGEHGVTSEWFHLPALALVYGVATELWSRGCPLTFISLLQKLGDARELDAAGGAGAVSDLFTYLPTAANAEYYLDILRDKHTLRRIIRTGAEYAGRAYSEQDACEALADDFEKAALQVRGHAMVSLVQTPKEGVMQALESIQSLYERRGSLTGLSTGLQQLDRMTNGLQPKQMIVIAARPSMGKSALMMNIAQHVAVDSGEPVAVFSLEMSGEELWQRVLCERSKVNLARVRDGFLAERDFPALTVAASQIAESNLYIDDCSSLSIQVLRGKARRLKQKLGIKALFVDYLQLLSSSSKRAQDNRQLEISEISAGLKGIAKELEIPVVVLAQLNRSTEQRSGAAKLRPQLSDLRESGSIEQDADLVAFLVREEYYALNDAEREKAKGQATLIIAKQRGGPVGDIPLTFLKEYTRFETRAQTNEP